MDPLPRTQTKEKAISQLQAIVARRKRLFGWAAIPILFVLLFLVLVPPVWKLKSSSVKVTRWLKSGEVDATVGPKEQGWIKVKTVSRHVLYAIVVAEDGRFYDHHGLDFTEILNSLAVNLEKKRYVRGGSTITQQVVKVAFLSREKSLWRKFREALGALLLEQILTKEEILEWYINLVEFGDNVYGIKAAARHYFSTKPELLTIEQGANLALVLPSPNRWSQGLRRRQLTPFGHKRFARIINNMRAAGFITEALWLHALATGDFGRPVLAYQEAIAKIRSQEFPDSEEASSRTLGEHLEKNLEALGEDDLLEDMGPEENPMTPPSGEFDVPEEEDMVKTDVVEPDQKIAPAPPVAESPEESAPAAEPAQTQPEVIIPDEVEEIAP